MEKKLPSAYRRFASDHPRIAGAYEQLSDASLSEGPLDRKLLLERNRVTRLRGGPYREVTLYEAVRPMRDACFNAGSYLYFERTILCAMHQAGRRAASSWLAAGPRIDHLDPPAAGLAAPIS